MTLEEILQHGDVGIRCYSVDIEPANIVDSRHVCDVGGGGGVRFGRGQRQGGQVM
jgi:hypothetical protein